MSFTTGFMDTPPLSMPADDADAFSVRSRLFRLRFRGSGTSCWLSFAPAQALCQAGL